MINDRPLDYPDGWLTWWLILHCSCHRRFHWMKTQVCLNFPISWRPYPANSMRDHLAWHTTSAFTKSKLTLHCIFGHDLSKYHRPIRPVPMTSQTICFAIPKILSQKCPSEPSSEKNEASFLAMENRLFDHLQDSMKLQTRAIYEILHHVLEDHHFDLASKSKGNTGPIYNRCPENNTTEQPSPNSASDRKENTKPSSPEVTLEQESPNSACDSDKHDVRILFRCKLYPTKS
jgi:hypothetical protein